MSPQRQQLTNGDASSLQQCSLRWAVSTLLGRYGRSAQPTCPPYTLHVAHAWAGSRTARIASGRRLGRHARVIALVALLVMACTACMPKGSNQGPLPASCSPQSDVICGSIVDTAGRPMREVDVEIGGTAMYSARTDAHGAYTVHVQDGLYQVHADLMETYQGATWVFPLYPSDGKNDEVSVSSGVVKDFAWRLNGPIPGMDPSNARDYYGATLKLIVQDPLVLPVDFTQSSLPPDSVLTITLTPQGTLVDGSTGQPRTYKRTLQAANNQGTQGGFDNSQVLGDMPLGTYTIAGTITTPDGATEALVFATGDQAYAQTATVTFQPAATSAGREGIVPQYVRVSTVSGR